MKPYKTGKLNFKLGQKPFIEADEGNVTWHLSYNYEKLLKIGTKCNRVRTMLSTGPFHELCHCFLTMKVHRESLEAHSSHCLIKKIIYIDL